MAEGGKSSQEKTEQPTPKKMRDARKKGQVSKSKDLDAVAVLTATFAAIGFSRSYISDQFQKMMEMAFNSVGKTDFVLEEIFLLAEEAFLTVVRVTAPIVITAMVTAAIVGFLQVGPVFSMETLKPQMKRLNFIENFKNMVKPKAFFELFKNIIKIIVTFLIAYSVLKTLLEPFLLTVMAPIEGSARLGMMVITRFMIRFLIVFLIVAIIDIWMQRKDYVKNLKMTKDEVKREYKEDEGDPMIKGQRKQIHQEMAMGDPRQAVKNADAVVTNPTELAVVIKYDREEMIAPQVVAKGQRLFAKYIRELAEEYDVPIIRNVPLAWSLFDLEVEADIPEDLYVTVAEILTFVYRLKEEKDKGLVSH